MQNGLNSMIESFKMMYFVNMKDSSVYDNMMIMALLTILSFIMNNDACYEKFEELIKNCFSFLSFLQPKRNTIILEGKRCLKVSSYLTRTDNLFSDRFSAFWYYISTNNLDNPSIYSLKEYAYSSNIYDDYGDPKHLKNDRIDLDEFDEEEDEDLINPTNKFDLLIVSQTRHFKIEKNIFCKVVTHCDKGDEKQKKIEMENITIELYSYKVSLKDLTKFLNKINRDYLFEINKSRLNKKFIYTLIGSSKSDDRENISDWEECEFRSTRNFNNLFFDDKKRLINKLNFFTNNKAWYQYEGHPYTFGIGLHGPPGTGKTSIIKCIANKLNRHIIVIPLNKIKTQREFSEYFFESYYNRDNHKKIDFKDKIIVFEDIDCMTNIVKRRDLSTPDLQKEGQTVETGGDQIDKNMVIQNKLLNKIAKKMDEEHEESLIVDIDKTKDDKITLSFILNIIDGIRETPGRILIITSNNYGSLDPALIRPGRIDLTLEMKNASVDTIKEMYNHYYGDTLPEEMEKEFRDYVVSPAKIVNLRLENENKEDFLSALKKEF